MGKRLKLKKRKREEKERPFDDSDTVIQWREDFVQDYIKEQNEFWFNRIYIISS